jgi:hypothetical protein
LVHRAGAARTVVLSLAALIAVAAYALDISDRLGRANFELAQTQMHAPNPQVCVDLLRLRSNLSQIEVKNHEWDVFPDRPLKEDVRTVMKNSGCSSD